MAWRSLTRVARRMGVSGSLERLTMLDTFCTSGDQVALRNEFGHHHPMLCSAVSPSLARLHFTRTFAGDASESQEDSVALKKLRAVAGKGPPDTVLEIIKEHGEEFGEAEVEEALNQFSSLAKGWSIEDKKSLHGDKDLQALIDMVILGRSRFQTRQLTNILQLAADLAIDDQMLLDRVSLSLIKRIGDMPASELTQLATSLERLDHSPSIVLFDAIQSRIVEIADSVKPDEKQALEKAFSKLGYGHDAISKKV